MERDPFAEEISPFTGNLPATPASTRPKPVAPTENQRASHKKVPDVTMVPVPTDNPRPGRTRGLWAYSDEAPKETRQPNRESLQEDHTLLPKRRSSRSLWSYSDNDQPGEKGR